MGGDTLHIVQAWPGSRPVPLPSGLTAGGFVFPVSDSLAQLAAFVLVLLFFMVACRRILEGMYYTAGALLNLKNQLIIENQSNPKSSRDTLLLFSLLLAAFVLSGYLARHPAPGHERPFYLNFLLTLAVAGGYLLFKLIFLAVLDWVNRSSVFKTLFKAGHTYVIWGILLAAAGFLVYTVFPVLPAGFLRLYAAVCACTAFLLYLIRGYQLIIANRFSHFFWILYLCTLEVLPILISAGIALS